MFKRKKKRQKINGPTLVLTVATTPEVQGMPFATEFAGLVGTMISSPLSMAVTEDELRTDSFQAEATVGYALLQAFARGDSDTVEELMWFGLPILMRWPREDREWLN